MQYYTLEELFSFLTEKINMNYGDFTNDDKTAILLRIMDLKMYITSILKNKSIHKNLSEIY